MIILGLTGGIGSGKSTVAKEFNKIGIPVFDADKEVKKLYEKKDRDLIRTIKKIDENNTIIKKKTINKKKLGDIVFSDYKKLEKLEKVIFKKIAKERRAFLKKNKKLKKEVVVLDIPLLFENNINKTCDFVIVAKTTLKERIKRILNRSNISRKRIKQIIKHQIPEKQKQKKADFILKTDLNKNNIRKQVIMILKTTTKKNDKQKKRNYS